MNYPLTQALLGFTAAHRLDREVIAAQQEYRQFVHPMDGLSFANELDQLMHGYQPRAARAQLNLLGSHDTPRFVTVAGGDVASLRLAVLAVMTLPGAPCIYYGDEVGVAGRHDPDCRRAFPWDEAAWDHGLRDFVRAAISLRASQPVLRHGEYRTLAAAGNAVAWGLYSADATAVIVLNADDRLTQLRLPADAMPGADVQPAALPGMALPRLSRLDTGELEVELAGRSGCVLINRSWGQ